MGRGLRLHSKLNYTDLLTKEFEWGGRGSQKYDCYGLVMEIYKRIGIDLPDFKSAKAPSLIQQSIIEGKKLFEEIEEPEPYCLVTFFIRPEYTSHLGVVLEDCKRFIHIMEDSMVTVEKLSDWEDRITGYLRWKA